MQLADEKYLVLTGVVRIVLSPGEDLQRAYHVHGVHAIVHGDENLEGLDVSLRFIRDCTHRDGWCLIC